MGLSPAILNLVSMLLFISISALWKDVNRNSPIFCRCFQGSQIMICYKKEQEKSMEEIGLNFLSRHAMMRSLYTL